jgi:hypothetical protein
MLQDVRVVRTNPVGEPAAVWQPPAPISCAVLQRERIAVACGVAVTLLTLDPRTGNLAEGRRLQLPEQVSSLALVEDSPKVRSGDAQ